MKGGEHLLKTLWHVGLVTVAVVEVATGQTRLRRFLAGAAAGWHTVAVLDDWRDFRNARKYADET